MGLWTNFLIPLRFSSFISKVKVVLSIAYHGCRNENETIYVKHLVQSLGHDISLISVIYPLFIPLPSIKTYFQEESDAIHFYMSNNFFISYSIV